MTVIPWTEIESFHNIRKYTQTHPEILNGDATVTYRAKVKLHGTNAAVQVHLDGTLVAQSRTTELSVTNDNAGFAKWVHSTDPAFWAAAEGMVIFGEWCGPGVQKGVAVSEIPKKIFAVFAARSLNPLNDELIVDPEHLAIMLKPVIDHVGGVYVLPWYVGNIPVCGIDGPNYVRDILGVKINWLAEEGPLSLEHQRLNEIVKLINDSVAAVEKNDPWVKETFNVDGTGEGLVFYPVSKEHLGVKNFNNLVFKAKGEKHKNIKTAAPAQVNAEAAASIDQFVDMVLTEARLMQGVENVATRDCSPQYDMKKIGQFLAWIAGDVQKETQDELAASGLTWNQVSKAVTNKARVWYLAKAKAL